MVKAKSKIKKTVAKETDSAYFLKLVLYVILGSQWLWITSGDKSFATPLPIGFVIGLLFARHDHFQIDRKIEYAILIVAALLAFWTQIGVYVNI